EQLASLIEVKNATIASFADGAAAATALAGTRTDCLVLPLQLRDMTAEEFPAALPTDPAGPSMPVPVYDEHPVDPARKTALKKAAPQRPVRVIDGPKRLRDELRTLFNPPILVTPSVRKAQKKAEPQDLARL